MQLQRDSTLYPLLWACVQRVRGLMGWRGVSVGIFTQSPDPLNLATRSPVVVGGTETKTIPPFMFLVPVRAPPLPPPKRTHWWVGAD